MASASSLWKDLSLVSGSFFLATLLTTLWELSGQTSFQLTLALFISALVGLVALALFVISAVCWRQTNHRRKPTVDEIKRRPCIFLEIQELDGLAPCAPQVVDVPQENRTNAAA